MRIKSIDISGYRSLREFHVKPGIISVIQGANGSGKSNIYNCLRLLKALAAGEFARSIVCEGGMSSILFAGQLTEKEGGRVKIGIRTKNLEYALRFGVMPQSERLSDGLHGAGLTYFKRDPDIKFEKIDFLNDGKAVTLLKRKRGSVLARNMEGRTGPYPVPLEPSESVLSALRDPQKFPELYKLRAELLSWRFYHDFRTDLTSPIRKPQRATLTPVLSDNGHDLASAIATIETIGDKNKFDQLFDQAFPGAQINIDEEDGLLEITMSTPGINRPLRAREFSDGTLQYLLLLAALLTPRPAPFMVLNEPETSIHSDLIEPLGELIKQVGKTSQVLVTTHSHDLAKLLNTEKRTRLFELDKEEGETMIPALGSGYLLDFEEEIEAGEKEEDDDDLMESWNDDDDDDDE